MGNMILRVGSQASKPYVFEDMGIRVSNIEELCFLLWENSSLLDGDIMDASLAEWLFKECKMTKLAHELHKLIRENGSFNDFVALIWSAAYFRPENVIAEIKNEVKANKVISHAEKRKASADMLLKSKKYSLAIKAYEKLYDELSKEEGEIRLKARTLHNLGVAYGRMYYFNMAATCFIQAYAYNDDPVEIEHFVACKRMLLSDADYIDFTIAKPEYYDVATDIQKKLDFIMQKWENEKMSNTLLKLNCIIGQDKRELYCTQAEALVAELRGEYRQYESI